MNLNLLQENKKSQDFNPGAEVFSWQSYSYHPHKRGIVWYTVFCVVLFGGAIWSIISDPQWGWLMALAFFLSAAVYFQAHRKGDEVHEVKVFERGIFVDHKFISLENFAGFWVLYNETVAMVNLQFKSKYQNKKISFQMGEELPEFFRENFAKINLPELEDTKESVLDLWIRALKL